MKEIIDRGSEWRKWDLHLHSLHNNLKGSGSYSNIKEEEFINKIKSEKIAVVGLTNYTNFSEKDFELADKLRKSGIVVFLNLEVRLTNLNDDKKLSDYHIIFSDELNNEEIKNVLARLDFTIEGTKKVANAIKSKKDFKSAAISFEKLQEVLKLESLHIKGKYLTGFLSRGHGSSVCGKGREYTVYENIAKNSDMVIHSSTFIENLKEDKKYWLGDNKYIKPLLQSSDAHDLSQIGIKKVSVESGNKEKQDVYQEGKKYFIDVAGFTWIKADLTFEGLKQIIYEPDKRIRYGKNNPDNKSDYLIIDCLEYENNEKIFLNSALNVIIGGRSTGKSTLLNSIAKYQNNSNVTKDFYLLEGDFAVKWRDGEINQERSVEFIPQDFMFDISREPGKLNKLLNKIISKKNLTIEEEKYKKNVEEIQNNINDYLNKYFSTKKSIEELIKPEGDKEGVKKSIKELEEKNKSIRITNKFSEEENKEYQEICEKINDLKKTLKNNKLEEKELSILKDININININNSNISDENKELLSEKLDFLKKQFNREWANIIEKIISELNSSIEKTNININNLEKSDLYIKGKNLEIKNSELKEIEKKLSKEKEIFDNFKDYESDSKKLYKEKNKCAENIIENFLKYKNEISSFKNLFSINEKNLDIKIETVLSDFDEEINYLNARSAKNNDFISNFKNLMNNIDEEGTKKGLLEIFNTTDLSFNKNKNIDDLVKDIFSFNWFNYNYNIIYQNDEFKNMSQGKKAFVILKLLLEFSDDKKPVLIDQPEDSLDNRAIYNELRNYIVNTKKERQIIIVTHNPNIVIGADAENVIVANQHNELEKNSNNTKFQYINGSLENTKERDKNCKYILESQGIKEHIFDILEGGAEAFAKREQKYNLK